MISTRLLEAVKGFEGFRPQVYRDGGGVLTWGYGNTHGIPPAYISEPEAAAQLQTQLEQAQFEMQRFIAIDLWPGAIDALTDFYFNVGPGRTRVKDGLVWLRQWDQVTGGPRHSWLYQCLMKKDFVAAALEFPKWNLVAGQPSTGLTKRRLIEQTWFNEYLTDAAPQTNTE